MLSRRISFFVVVLGVFVCASANSQSERIPAGFDAGEKSLDKLIKYPEISGDIDRTLLCQGVLKKNGKLDQPACYLVNRGDELFAASVTKALKKARFTPAIIGGKARGVYLQYRIRFTRTGEDEDVILMANQGYLENIAEYGDSYVAAQRAITDEKWQKICPRRAHYNVISKLHVAYDGMPSSISITHGSGINISNTCEQAIIETLQQSDFVPALADGQPVPSTYVEAFGN